MRDTESGLSLLETLIGSALLMGVVVGLFYGTQLYRQQASRLTTKTSCHAFAENFVSNLKTANGPIRIRNWLPTKPGELKPPEDTLDHFKIKDGTIDTNEMFFNSQNILNTTNWAMTLYNKYNPRICRNEEGQIFTGESIDTLLKSLPIPLERPSDLQSIKIHVMKRDKTKDLTKDLSTEALCSEKDVVAHPKLPQAFKIKADFTFAGGVTFCNAEFEPQFHGDDSTLAVIGAVRNGANRSLPLGANTCGRECKRGPEDSDPEKVPNHRCEERNKVTFIAEANEPGALIFCKRVGPAWGAQEDSGYRSCHEIGHNFNSLTNENAKTHMEVTFPNLPDNKNEVYGIHFLAVDTGGNINEQKSFFIVRYPECGNPTDNRFAQNGENIECKPDENLWLVAGHTMCLGAEDTPTNCGNMCKLLRLGSKNK